VPLLAAVPVVLFGSTQVVRQFAAVELQDIMQLVTVDATVVVCGATGAGVCCANAPAIPMSAKNPNDNPGNRTHRIAGAIAVLRMACLPDNGHATYR
jgi:hypothetical protein